jgi:hypothetical protein
MNYTEILCFAKAEAITVLKILLPEYAAFLIFLAWRAL